VITPSYRGRLWIDQQADVIVRLQVEARQIPPNFPIRSAKIEIDYENVLFGDGTSFVLPVKAVVNAVNFDGVGTRNIQRFQNCQKFRATSRVVLQEKAQ
jgi:hypothetical protein